LNLSAFFLLTACLSALPPIARAKNVASAVPAIMLEEPSGALCQWYKEGKRGMTLVRISSKPDILSAGFMLTPDREILKRELETKSCGELSPRTSYHLQSDALYTVDDYVYPAFLLGVVSEVWWVVPSKTAVPEEDLEKFKGWLQARYAFPNEFIKSLQYSDGIIKGKFNGMPINMTIIENLPSFEQPVLLDVDTDYFSALYENPVKESMLSLLGRTRLLLNDKNLKIDMATISSSNQTPVMSVLFNYLREYLYEIFTDPDKFSDGPPQSWKTQNEIEYQDYMLARDDALKEAEKLIKDLPEKPWPYFDVAWINVERGNFEEAKKHLEKAVELDEFYARGYFALASQLYQDKKHDQWIALMDEAIEKHPNRLELYVNAADALVDLEKFEKAASYYEGAVKVNDKIGYLYFDLAMAYLKMGDKDKARQNILKFKSTALPGQNRLMSLAQWEKAAKALDWE